MKKIIFLVIVLGYFFPKQLNAQNLEQKIKALQDSVGNHENAIDAIFGKLEELKLKKITGDLKLWAFPEKIEGEEIIHHSAFSLSYNEAHEQANWVAHIITKDVLYGAVSRTNDFRVDPKVSTATVDSADYWYSGFDRGHLAPSADFRWSKKALSESYYYSNMSPQRPELNRESWAKLENQVREWAIDAGQVYVITGPVLREDLPKIPQGTERVSIPELFYKVIIDYEGPEYKGIGFVLPNKKADYRVIDYAVSIDSIEQLTGINFFPNLPDSIENLIEANNEVMKWPINYQSQSGDIMPIDFATGQVGTMQAKYFIGDECTVCGKVVSAKYRENGKSNPTYINLDKKFPEHVFTVVIFGKNRINFTYKPEEELYGKKICVKGKVGEYKGIPQIIVNGQEQIEIF